MSDLKETNKDTIFFANKRKWNYNSTIFVPKSQVNTNLPMSPANSAINANKVYPKLPQRTGTLATRRCMNTCCWSVSTSFHSSMLQSKLIWRTPLLAIDILLHWVRNHRIVCWSLLRFWCTSGIFDNWHILNMCSYRLHRILCLFCLAPGFIWVCVPPPKIRNQLGGWTSRYACRRVDERPVMTFPQFWFDPFA